MYKINEIIGEISIKNPVHGKRLRGMLGDLSTEFYDKSEHFFKKYESYAVSQGKSLEYGIDSYLKMLSDMIVEYVYFVKHNEYSCKSFEDSYERVYNNPDIMEYYMHGLLMSQYLWKHHYDMHTFFSKNLSNYKPSRYLEIGGGHGAFLEESIKQFGKDCYFEMVDISSSSLEMAKSFINNSKVTYKLQDIYDYKLEKQFDFITMGEVLEHVEDPKSLLIALGKLLDDKGTAFITTPTNAPAIDHIYLFRNEKEIESLINESGFKIINKLWVTSEEDESKPEEKSAMLYGAFIKKN